MSAMSGRPGVLLVNLGTPDAPTPEAVRRYLAEFLSDRRVVDLPPLLWQPILRGIILRTRPKKSARAYAEVWSEEGSPLAAITAAQARALQDRLGDSAVVTWGMRYGNPGLAAAFDHLRQTGCERVLVAPLYPQYSGATNASAADGVDMAMKARAWRPELRTMPPYFDNAAYIAALRGDIDRQLAGLPFVPEVLLLSFHGLPQRQIDKGDPYEHQCRATARLLGEALYPLRPDLRVETAFQSRFGPAKWIGPATDAIIDAEAARGTKRMVIAAPGFSADCLETREELAIRGREQFIEAGGEQFAVLDCLNAGDAGMAMIEELVRRELADWLKQS